jgi:2-polyprenyl-3-methyl-5-hydroxy-6-metoxy-1,4-benzoquinol methylase
MSIGKPLYSKFLNSGERYDPSIAKMIKWRDKCHIERYKFVKQFINKEITVLDIACGTGYGSKILSSHCKLVIGVDISSQAIEYANSVYKTKKIQFVEQDFFNNKFIADIVVSFETIEHIKHNDFTEVISQLIHYSDKLLIASIPYKEIPNNNPYHYFFNLDEESILPLNKYGKLDFYYQDLSGKIYSNKPVNIAIQNLIFVLTK